MDADLASRDYDLARGASSHPRLKSIGFAGSNSTLRRPSGDKISPTEPTTVSTYPQFPARIGDYDIHFCQVKGRGPKPLPLILTHGWPGSTFEFIEAIGPLSDPASFGGSPGDAFDVVVPSLPGFGFSSKPIL
jgi:pimeloyl-ACP methyl ester carboxylesterase